MTSWTDFLFQIGRYPERGVQMALLQVLLRTLAPNTPISRTHLSCIFRTVCSEGLVRLFSYGAPVVCCGFGSFDSLLLSVALTEYQKFQEMLMKKACACH